MSKKPLFWETFMLLVLVGVLDAIARRFDLYWNLKEFDSLLHFLGGAAVSIFFLWLYFFSGVFNSPKRKLRTFLLISFLGVLFIAVLWEIYELVMGEAKFHKVDYGYDTTIDFIMDFLGAFAACLYGYFKELADKKII